MLSRIRWTWVLGGVFPLSAFEIGLASYCPEFSGNASGMLSYVPLAVPGIAPIIAFLCSLYLIHRLDHLSARSALIQLVVLAISAPLLILAAVVAGLGAGMLVTVLTGLPAALLGSRILALAVILALPIGCLVGGWTMGRWFAAVQQHFIGSKIQSAGATLRAHSLGGALSGLLLGAGWTLLITSPVDASFQSISLRRMLPLLILSLLPYAVATSRLPYVGDGERHASLVVIGRIVIATLSAAAFGLSIGWVWHRLT